MVFTLGIVGLSYICGRSKGFVTKIGRNKIPVNDAQRDDCSTLKIPVARS